VSSGRRVGVILALTLLVSGLLFCVLWSRCLSLIAKSVKSVTLPMPSSCSEVKEVEDNDLTTVLQRERIARGLSFQSWIECDSASADILSSSVEHDPHWLESYIPFGYQYRRTVVVPLRPGGVVTTDRAPVVAAILVQPWPSYLRLIRGECDDQLRVWE
jgi:hypothetical protein